jgi:hypothetical protein
LPIWVTEYSSADWNATWNSITNTTQHTIGLKDSNENPLVWSALQSADAASIAANSTGSFMEDTVDGMNNMLFVERYSWKERFLLSPYGTASSPAGTPPGLQLSIQGPTNVDYMNQSALFNSYVHFPVAMPTLTPLGQLYASLLPQNTTTGTQNINSMLNDALV